MHARTFELLELGIELVGALVALCQRILEGLALCLVGLGLCGG